jgi:hypothetical protein
MKQWMPSRPCQAGISPSQTHHRFIWPHLYPTPCANHMQYKVLSVQLSGISLSRSNHQRHHTNFTVLRDVTIQYKWVHKTSVQKRQQSTSTRVKPWPGNFHTSRYSNVWAHKGLSWLKGGKKGSFHPQHILQNHSSTTTAEGKLFQYCQKQMKHPGEFSAIRTKRSSWRKALQSLRSPNILAEGHS